MPDPDFHPQTAREALLEIRRLYVAGGITDDLLRLLKQIDATAELGLERREPINFEMSDELGDRLAEAHKALRRICDEIDDPGGCAAGIANEVLGLPPDLEAIVERRIGPWS